MKAILLITSILCVNLLHSQDFKIIEATSQKWTGGRARSGYGVNYKLTIVSNKKLKKLHFEKLWVGKEAFPIKVVKNKHEILSVSKNDTIYLTARKRVKTDEYGNKIKEKKNEEKAPVKYKTGAFLSYKIKKKDKFMPINKLKKLKAIFYP